MRTLGQASSGGLLSSQLLKLLVALEQVGARDRSLLPSSADTAVLSQPLWDCFEIRGWVSGAQTLQPPKGAVEKAAVDLKRSAKASHLPRVRKLGS